MCVVLCFYACVICYSYYCKSFFARILVARYPSPVLLCGLLHFELVVTLCCLNASLFSSLYFVDKQ